MRNIDIKKGLTRRNFIIGGAVLVGGVAAAQFFGPDGSEDEYYTELWTGDEEECEEEEEELTLGERIAHIACAIALSAIDDTDGERILTSLGINGTSGDMFSFDGVRFKNNIYSDASWASTHVGLGTLGDADCGNPFCDGYTALPNEDLPHAMTYIDFAMGKGSTRDGFSYVDPREDIWEDKEHGIVKAEYSDVVVKNRSLIPDSYATFSKSNALPCMIHGAYGLNYRQWFSVVAQLQGGAVLSDIMPSGSADFADYVLHAYDDMKSLAEQCKSGDILVVVGDSGETHWAIYVGNKLAKRYFLGTTGDVCEASAPETFAGLTSWDDDLGATINSRPNISQMLIASPKNKDVEPNQEIPQLKIRSDCKEPPIDLPVGERIAHCACGIALCAVGHEKEVENNIKSLGLWNDCNDAEHVSKHIAGTYSVWNSHVCNHVMRDPVYRAQNDFPGYDWTKHWSVAAFFPNILPNLGLRNAQNNIWFTMCKGLDPNYGQYLPDETIRNPENRWMRDQNVETIDGYTWFTMCGTCAQHVVWAHGGEKLGLSVLKVAAGTEPDVKDPGCNEYGGFTPEGIRWATTLVNDPSLPNPHQNCCATYFPDNIIGIGPALETETYKVWSVNPNMTYAEQCEPGDYLYVGPPAHLPDSIASKLDAYNHGMLYVGNEIARKYWPNTPGTICDAGGPHECFMGIWGNENLMGELGYTIIRVKQSAMEIRQWTPPIRS